MASAGAASRGNAASMSVDDIVNGSFGKVFINGIWQTNINHLDAAVEPNKKELILAGEDWTSHKCLSKKGSGTMSGFKTTSAMIALGFKRFEIITKVDDPESRGCERIRLLNCMVDKVSLANWTAGEEVTEEIPFTFKGYEPLDIIT